MRINIKDIVPNPANPRVIRDEQFRKLKQSLAQFPQMLEKRPIAVTKEGGKYIALGGNQRLRALLDLEKEIEEKWFQQTYYITIIEEQILEGYFATGIPVVDCTELTPMQQKRFIIADNVPFGEWDWEGLANEWDVEELADWGLSVPGWEATEDESEKASDEELDESAESAEEIQTDIKLGDLFEIGPHRLLCGDSTSEADVSRLMNGRKAELAHNDPPYGMKKEKDGVLNDNLNFSDLLDFNKKWINIQFNYLKENGSWYCWGIDEPLMDIYSEILKPLIKQQRATFRNLITWNKGNGQGQMSENTRMYAVADEKCLFVMCGVQGFNDNADNYFEGLEPIRKYLLNQKEASNLSNKEIQSLTSTSHTHYWSRSQWQFPTEKDYNILRSYCEQNGIDAFKKEYDELKKEYYSTRAYFNNTHENQNSVWSFDRAGQVERELTGGHATPKPIALCSRAIKSSCPEKGLVIDLFLGSGSTMVAAQQCGRTCYGLELDPKYCQVIVNRMQKLYPSLQITKNGQPYATTNTTTEGE